MSKRVIGARGDCDVVLNEPQVSGHHCSLEENDGRYYLTDLDSTNGTFVNEVRITSAEITHTDQISLGSFAVSLQRLLAQPRVQAAPRPVRTEQTTDSPCLDTLSQRPDVTEVAVSTRTRILGRERGRTAADGTRLDIQVEGGRNMAVSGQHARVFCNAGRVILEDMGSMSGTFLVQGGIGAPTMVRYGQVGPNDLVKIGNEYFQFRKALQPVPMESGQRVDVRDLCYEVAHQDTGMPIKLVNGVSFSAFPGDMIGIMGPSGSGKTTLLNMIAGFNVPTDGEVLLNGQPIYSSGVLDPVMGRLIGHAPQFDASHAKLTVQETLEYTARLRGPSNWSESDVQAAISKALSDVGLEPQRHTRVGSKDEKTLSGGQRKRVNIAMELVTGCQILLLDEPTSGLSSHDTSELMETLRNLANGGKTIILTIHQPAYDSYIQMDHLLLLEEGGHTAYFGPTAKNSFDYFGVSERDVDVILRQLERKPNREIKGKWASHFEQEGKAFVKARLQSSDQSSPAVGAPVPSLLQQLSVLTGRLIKLKARDPGFLGLATLFPVLVALIFSLVIGAEITDEMMDQYRVEHGMIVILTIMTCFFGALGTVLEFTSEKAVWKRESRSSVSSLAYLISKLIIYSFVAVVFPLLASGTVMVFGLAKEELLSGGLMGYWSSLGMGFLAAASAGLALSAFVSSRKIVSFNLAVYMAVLYSILQVVFAVFAPLNITYEQTVRTSGGAEETKAPRAEPLRWVSTLTTARWSISGALAQSDLCKELETQSANPIVQSERQQHLKLCTKNYENAGIHPASSEDDRLDSQVITSSYVYNLILSILAWVVALVFIRRSGQS